MRKLDRLLIKYILFIAAVVLIVFNYEQVLVWLSRIWLILSPVIIGGVMAYILNILMVKFESWYFPSNQKKIVVKTRRPVSILLAMATIILVVFLVVGLVVPQVISVIATLIENIPTIFERIQAWFTEYEQLFPEAATLMDQFNIDWGQMVRNAVTFVNNITASILETTLSTVGSLAGIVINLV